MSPDCDGTLPEGGESSDTLLVAGVPHHWHTLPDRGGSVKRLHRGRGHDDPARDADRARAAFNEWVNR